MILPRFDLEEPATINEVCQILQKQEKARVIAGGTDLLVNMKKKVITPEVVVSLSTVPGLNSIDYSPDKGVTIGSMVRISDITNSPEIKARYPGLADSGGKLGSPQIRNRATIGGNICSARPAADMAGPLTAYGAVAVIATPNGMREQPIEKLYKGPGQTTLGKGEFLVAFKIKTPEKNTGICYIKYGIRHAMEIALVSVTSLVVIDKNICRSAKVVLGAVAPTFIHCPKTEEFLNGKELSEAVAEQAGEMASGECSPITDIRASADYRRQLVHVLTKRSLLQASKQLN
jgi:aerobic carbon-monoxide dehydrogenase medium subunit